jgi:hypothetical protein
MDPKLQKEFLAKLIGVLCDDSIDLLSFRLPAEERPTSQHLIDLHRLLVDLWIRATENTLNVSLDYEYAIAIITWMQTILALSYGLDDEITGLVRVMNGRQVSYQVAAESSIETFLGVNRHIGTHRVFQTLRNPIGAKLVLAMLDQQVTT